MDYEKKYKNALEWARQVMNGKTGFIRKEVEEVFPELAESENEKIRKAIIEIVHDTPDCEEDYNVSKEDLLAWLEKQGQVKENQILQHKDTHEDVSCKENDNSLTREQKPQRFISAEAKEALYGEPTAWSESDERFLNQTIEEVDYALNDKDIFYNGDSPLIDWLKDLKRRLGGE